MRRIAWGLGFMSFLTLMLELLLTRVFDVIDWSNMAYMIVSCALLAFGLAGIYGVFRPWPQGRDLRPVLARLALSFGVAVLAIRPLLNLIPFNSDRVGEQPLVQLVWFGAMYLVLVVPFFISGLVFVRVFSAYASQIRRLYFFDLLGAALGCVAFVPLIPTMGPGGLMMCGAALALVAAVIFGLPGRMPLPALAAAAVLVAVPVIHSPAYYEFRIHIDKRGVEEARAEQQVETSRWDPISRIDVIPIHSEFGSGARRYTVESEHVAYDGGSQSSHYYPFDGDYARLRAEIDSGAYGVVRHHFWNRMVLASDVLKEGTHPRVLIIGSAAGQETVGALTYQASHVDGIEMVGAVVDLGLHRYSRYIGDVFNDPRVSVRVGEGRSFLRSHGATYDIIQIFSNYTTSSIGSGNGAMATVYLQTVEAYQEYFSHLSADGVLQINHMFYPRMITTAAAAWRAMGRTDFQSHVAVFARTKRLESIPTLMIKMSPWTPAELARVRDFLTAGGEDEDPIALVVNPLEPDASFLPPSFFSGDLPAAVVRATPYRVVPATDDRPYFTAIRTTLGTARESRAAHVDRGTAGILNMQQRRGIPLEYSHLIVTGIVSLCFAVGFILIPLLWTGAGRERWSGQVPAMIYFAALGGGFIVIELVLIQIFMKLIGFPLYTYAAVIFTLLLAAGLGSVASARLEITRERRWWWPFAAILVAGVALLLVQDAVFRAFLAAPLGLRLLAAAVLIFPVGFFLGMPFPLGIGALEGAPRGTIAWAWGLNGIFTVIGSLASVVLSLVWGFRVTVLIALAVYLLAALTFAWLRRAAAPTAHPGSRRRAGPGARADSWWAEPDVPLRRQLPVHSPLGLAALAAGARALLSPAAGLDAEAEVQRRLAERFSGAAVLRTDSGTSALRLALHALGVARTGPVALPAYCCYDIATAADGAGVPVLLYDLDPLTLGPSFPSLVAVLEAGAQAVVAVHLYGVPADLGEICRLAEQHRALVVEDAAQGAGMSWEGRPAGATGSLGVLSFGRGKGCTGGGGGALLANDAAGERALAVARHELARGSGGGDRLAAAGAQWLLGRPSLYGVPASLPFLGLGETVYREPTPAECAARRHGGDSGCHLGGRRAREPDPPPQRASASGARPRRRRAGSGRDPASGRRGARVAPAARSRTAGPSRPRHPGRPPPRHHARLPAVAGGSPRLRRPHCSIAPPTSPAPAAWPPSCSPSPPTVS